MINYKFLSLFFLSCSFSGIRNSPKTLLFNPKVKFVDIHIHTYLYYCQSSSNSYTVAYLAPPYSIVQDPPFRAHDNFTCKVRVQVQPCLLSQADKTPWSPYTNIVFFLHPSPKERFWEVTGLEVLIQGFWEFGIQFQVNLRGFNRKPRQGDLLKNENDENCFYLEFS